MGMNLGYPEEARLAALGRVRNWPDRGRASGA